MYLKVNKLLTYISIICILNSITKAYGDCLIEFSQDVLLRPNIFLKIGSRNIDMIIKNSDNKLSLHDKQEIEAHCSIKFEKPNRYTQTNKLNVKCSENRIFVNSYNYHDSYITLECSSLKWNLYETSNNFAWCPANVTSYLLARPKENLKENYEYLAGVCYDTHNLSFKSIYYTIAPRHNKNMYTTVPSNFYKPSLEVKYIKETFVAKSINETDYDNHDIQDWIKYAQYNYTTVIQNSILHKEFNDELGALLDLAWWPNLRLGNWRRYESALTAHIETQQQTYNVLAGVSAVAAAPIIETCKTNYTLKDLVDYRNQEIPMYIWNYLRSINNSSNEIVIIGFNSPFYEFYNEMDVIFCKDKCHEISWLKNVSTTFRYNALGVMFCCSVDEVKTSKRLIGFPQINMDSEPTVGNVAVQIEEQIEEQLTTMATDTDELYL